MDPALLLLILIGLLALAGAVGWRLSPAFLPFQGHVLDRLALASLIGMTIYHGLPLLAGQITGRMSPLWMGLFAATAGSLLLLPRRFFPTAFQLRSSRGVPSVRKALILLSPSLLLTLALGLSASRWPARVYDAVTYHMVNPMVWYNTGQWDLSAFGPAAFDPSESQATTFPNPKAVTPWLTLHLQPDGRGTALAQWPFILLMVPCMAALGWRLKIRGVALGLLPLFVLFMPEVALQSQESYADLALLSALMATAWAGALLLLAPHPQAPPFSLNPGVPLGLGLAWIVATKPTGLLLAPLALLVVILLSRFRKRRLPLRTWLPGTLLVAVIAAQVLAGPWYWRGVLDHGNPIFPIRVSLGPIQLPGVFDPAINSVMMQQLTGRTGLSAWFHTLWEWPRPAALSSWTGGLGAIVALLAVPLGLLAICHGVARLFGRTGPRMGPRFTPPAVLFFCGMLVALAVPTAGVARFLLFPAATLFFLLPATLHALPRAMAIPIMLAVGLGLVQDAGRILTALYFQQRDPAVLSVLSHTGGQGAAREDRWPGDISVLTILRDDLLVQPDAVLASRDLRPWLVQPALPRGRWFRRLGPSPSGETPTEFLARVRATEANLLHVRLGTPEWELAQQALPAKDLLADLSPLSSSYRHGPPAPVRQAVWRLRPLKEGQP